ncbi:MULTISPECIES: S8 family peptidase [unclassified Eubacterium (in: firmicutes)]|jgi:subtilisin family serine protease|uniref:S8 family peptidase n=1 Tax=Eubacterium TaxID=1730 RepID=UPI000339C541|nr:MULTISPECIES: S8 family peptidase [unclassified Eubacterium (in: firmicutes)]MCJ7966533.1 S8 family peptidase [Lachnospiraceae bacterium NSJ-171]RGG67455.1 peptidase [Eubacterium sp. AF17-7]RHR35264.1 peptidase [Eubacterium sp. AF19-12LB]CDA28320.1 peptidase S8/S53 family [Eubacterium sp. CAG:156]
MASENMMSECAERIISEDYADFIIEIGFRENEARQEYKDLCIQDIGYKFSAIYYPLSEINPISVGEDTYIAIPKLFGLMDTSAVEATGALRLQRVRGTSLTGNGVIVGFIDTGIDYTNDIFKNVTGRTRILSIWDQSDQSGTHPQGIEFGSEYTREDIDRALQSENPYSIVPTKDTQGHGTFMAGVACGSEDVENNFIGAANESQIAVVKLKKAKKYLRDFYLIEENVQDVYQENDIMQAVTYLRNLSRRESKPLVLVLGLGTGSGQRSGGSALSQQLNDLGEMIGCCVVTCAGNEGNARLHYKGSVLNKEYEDVELRVGEGTNGFTMELWGNSPDIISVAFISPSGEMISRIPARVGQSDTVEFLLEKSKIDISYSLVEAGGGVELIFMRFIDPTPGVWIIRVYGNNILEGDYNIWLPIKQFIDKETYFLKPNPDITLTVPSTTQATITVAAYDNMTNALFTDSSRGFTRTNEIKPDITAPGVNVYGPGINNNYVRKSGTSVAAALVAGNCAQLMQWGIVEKNETQMKTNYIKNFLIRGAIRDRNIVYPSKEWGYGKVNVYEAFSILRNK